MVSKTQKQQKEEPINDQGRYLMSKWILQYHIILAATKITC